MQDRPPQLLQEVFPSTPNGYTDLAGLHPYSLDSSRSSYPSIGAYVSDLEEDLMNNSWSPFESQQTDFKENDGSGAQLFAFEPDVNSFTTETNIDGWFGKLDFNPQTIEKCEKPVAALLHSEPETHNETLEAGLGDAGVEEPNDPMDAIRRASKREELFLEGFDYRFGRQRLKADLKESYRCYEEAYELGSIDALAALAVAHLFGLGVKESQTWGKMMLREAILKGSVDALEIQALMLMSALQDGRRRFGCCLETLGVGVARSSATCLLWTGFCFELGLGTPPDKVVANQAYLAAGSSNSLRFTIDGLRGRVQHSADAWSMLKVGLYLLNVITDHEVDEEAIECIEGSARLGMTDAKVYLAICLLQGKGISSNVRRAVSWLQNARCDSPRHEVVERLMSRIPGMEIPLKDERNLR